MLPLIYADKGNTVEILKIGGSAEVKKRLENLGFTPGEHVVVISEAQGNLIVNIRDTRIALNQAIAGKIMVC